MMSVSSLARYAVITGDFIGFSPLSVGTRENLYDLMIKGGCRLNQLFGHCMPESLDVFRGDAWQMLFSDPAVALRAGLFYRAFIRAHAPLRHIDVRMAIGVGTVDYVPRGRVSAGDGEAFRRSGKLLETMVGPRSGTLRFAMDESPASAGIDGLAVLAGAVAGNWTPPQALALTGALAGMSQKEIAAVWEGGISFQAVSRHLRRAGWPALRHGIDMYEKTIRAMMAAA